MTELIKIKCNWNPNGDMIFNELDSWEGNVLLEEDGWFEGVVTDNYTEKDFFVYGVYRENKGIELHKLSSSLMEKPLLFHGIKKTDGYEGSFEDDESPKRNFLGASLINTAEEDIHDLDYICKTKEVENRIARFKYKAFEKVLKKYKSILAKRTIACEKLSDFFEGAPYDKYIDSMNGKKEENYTLPFEEELEEYLGFAHVDGDPLKLLMPSEE